MRVWDIGRNVWERFWYAPDTAQNLAFVRIFVAAHALWILLSRDLGAISGLTDFWVDVPPAVQWRYLLFPGHASLEQGLEALAVAATVAAMLGIYPRVACFLAGMLIYHLAPLETIIWSSTAFARGLTLTPILLIVLAAAPSGDAYRLWPPRRGRPVGPGWQYGWPRRLTFLLVAQIYLFAAWAKLLTAGLGWSSAENIRRWLLLYNLDDRWVFHSAGLWIAEHPLLCLGVGVGTVAFEWVFVLAVFRRDARLLLVPLALAFQAGILIAMNIHVGETWLVLTFLDWDRVIDVVRGRARILRQATVQPG